MRSVVFDPTDTAFPAQLVEMDDPRLPGRHWARVRVTGGGICGSDLHMFRETTGPVPVLGALVPIPFQLGHEVAGVVVESGSDCAIKPGTRVAIDPTFPCAAREIDPPCAHCAAGAPSACTNVGSKVATPGFMLGYTFGLGGGWSDAVVVHESMLHPLPDGITDHFATLYEPLSIAIHGILRYPPAGGAPVLVAGAGIIGLAAVVALRALFPKSEVTVLAKHEHQARAAERLGARRVVRLDWEGRHVEELAEIVSTRTVGAGNDAMLVGGFPYVIEAVGTPLSVTQALRFTEGRGTTLLLGIPGVVNVDLTPVWMKEIVFVGALIHAPDAGPHGGPIAHSIDRAIDILAEAKLSADALITHDFPLNDFRRGIETALERGSNGVIKVVLRP